METKMTSKTFLFKVLNGLSLGIVVSLIPNALLSELSKALMGTFPVFGTILTITQISVSLLTVAIGVGVSMEFKLSPIQTATVSIATLVGSGVASIGENGAFIFKGTGDVINAGITAAIAVAIILAVGDKLKAYTMLVIPAGVMAIAGGIGLVTLPYVKLFTAEIGHIVLNTTELQPIPMGALICLIFSILIVSPISATGIALAISIDGIGSGAANLGITTAAIVFAVSGFKSNTWAVFIAHLMGSPKMQLPNFIKKPLMMAPVLCTAVITGIAGVIFNISGDRYSAGFGISGLIGPIKALELADGGYSTKNILIVILVFFIIPLISALFFDYLFKKVLKIVEDDDYRLDFN